MMKHVYLRLTALPPRWESAFSAVLLAAMLVLPACKGNQERIVQEKVAERVSEFRRKESDKCRDALLANAERIVDSLLLHEALHEVTDSLRGLRPFRPVKPPSIAPIDSLEVKPIFEKDGR